VHSGTQGVGEAGSGGGSRRTAASSICATSTTSTLSGAEPAACWDVRASDSITRQNGQATAIWSAPVATASSVRLPLILVPSFSSIHIRAPPAPQQNERLPCRGISVSVTPGSAPISGPARPLHDRHRRAGLLLRPTHPWQRGTNENTNGLLRQYFPKRTSFSSVTQEHLDAVAAELNGRPRQTLGFVPPSRKLDELLR
jgi:hypothetical protein